MKKIFAGIMAGVLAVTMAGSLAGCGTGDDENTLVVWVSNPLKPDYESLLALPGGETNRMALYTQAVVESFEAAHEGVTVRLENRGWMDALNSQVLSAAQSNSLPDLMMGEMYMPIYMERGLLKPLDLGEYADVLPSGIADSVTKDGQLYGAPFSTGVFALQYNPAVLEAAGIPEEDWIPETWDELLVNSQKVAEANTVNGTVSTGGFLINNVAGISGAFRALPFVRQAGGDFLNANGEPDFASDAAKQAYTFLSQLAKTTVTGSLDITAEDQLHNLFISGAAAYQVEGPWTLAEADDSFRAAPLPQPTADSDTNANAYVGNLIMAKTRDCDNDELADAFVQHLLSPEMQWELFKADVRLPTNMDFLTERRADMIAERSYFETYIDIMLEGGFTGGLPSFSRNASRIWETWGSFYRNVLLCDVLSEIGPMADNFNETVKGLI